MGPVSAGTVVVVALGPVVVVAAGTVVVVALGPVVVVAAGTVVVVASGTLVVVVVAAGTVVVVVLEEVVVAVVVVVVMSVVGVELGRVVSGAGGSRSSNVTGGHIAAASTAVGGVPTTNSAITSAEDPTTTAPNLPDIGARLLTARMAVSRRWARDVVLPGTPAWRSYVEGP